MVKIFLLPANEGDFIWISYGENDRYSHILIDGGLKYQKRAYISILNNIYQRGEYIEAILLTHVDNDHIQGALEGLNEVSADISKKVIKKIYFNTCRGIKENLNCGKLEDCVENEVTVKENTPGYGIGEAITFLELLERKGISDRLEEYVVAGETIGLSNGGILKIISPGEKQLLDLAKKWEKHDKKKVKGYAANKDVVGKDLEELMEERLTQDSSVNNASSIACLFEYDSVRLALLGDSIPAVCIEGMKRHQLKLPYPVDGVKLSHHGSRGNTSDQLLNSFPTMNYLLSTDGHGEKVPSKVVIAHLLKNRQKQGCVLFCNYRWWETVYHNKYFTEKDKREVIDKKKLQIRYLGKENVEIKNGLIIYGSSWGLE